jgi:hypothetical protein
MPYPSADEEWWEQNYDKRKSTPSERKRLISKQTENRLTLGTTLCCLCCIFLVAILPTVIIAVVCARFGYRLEQETMPLAQQSAAIINDAHSIMHTANVATRLVHDALNKSVNHMARVPLAMDMTIGTINETKRFVNRLANMAEHPPSMTVNVG